MIFSAPYMWLRRSKAWTPRASSSTLLVVMGLLWAMFGALFPEQSGGRTYAPLLGLAGVGLGWWQERKLSPRLALLFALILALAAISPDLRLRHADSPKYFAYLRSLAKDGDLDFANEWTHWGEPPPPLTPTGHRFTQASIGPALMWAPFYLVADGLVRAGNMLGLTSRSVEGYGPPYLRSTLAGTVVFVVLGTFALGQVLARRYSKPVTVLSILAILGATPMAYYTFVHGGMSHGLAFALTAFAIFLADRLESVGRTFEWFLLGLVLGLLVAVRLQAAVVGVFMLPFLWGAARRGFLSARGLGAIMLGGLLGFLPQLLAWKVIYGSYITVGADLEAWAREAGLSNPVLFQPASWFNPRSVFWREVLFSAHHGLFNWTPLCLVGLLGLPLALGRAPQLALGGLFVFLAITWFNGSLADRGGDAFGGRRFDVFFPFAALGVAAVLELAVRRPLLGPTVMLASFVAWNLGFMRLHYRGTWEKVVPLPELAAAQVRQAEELSTELMGQSFGARGRAFVYDTFVAQYLELKQPDDGSIEMGQPTLRYLAGGWSPAVNRTGPPQFRSAYYPRACLQLPLMVAAPLRARIEAKAPARITEQTVALVMNGHPSPAQALASGWTALVFDLPREHARPGENTLCLQFSAGAQKHEEERRFAAHVRRVVLESRAPTHPNPVWGILGLGQR